MAAFKTLGKQTQTFAIPPKQFYGVASASTKDENMSGERLLMQYRLYLRTQAGKPSAHICNTGGNPYLRSRAQLDRGRKLSRAC